MQLSVVIPAYVVEEFIARAPEVGLLPLPHNRGKGGGVRAGMMAANGDAVLFSEAERALKLLVEGNDVVIGSRALPGSRILVRQTCLRESMGRLFNLLLRVLLRAPFRDQSCNLGPN